MCGIVAYIGDKDITSILLVGLERLSYRGYDSSGIALLSGDSLKEISVWKKEGKIRELAKYLEPFSIRGRVGIGHTRWATHGEANDRNAHPHLCSNRKFAIVHNGIIENYQDIKTRLKALGYLFESETDSEVIVHLILHYFKNSLEEAVREACKDLDGSYALAVISEMDPSKIVAVRKGSPLIIGVGENECHLASDLNAIIPHTKKVIFLDDNELAIIKQHEYHIQNSNGDSIEKPIQTISWSAEASEKDGFDSFMEKEIREQPAVVRRVLNKYVIDQKVMFKSLEENRTVFANASRFIIQACGTSWHAGLFGKYLIEKYARIPAEVDISSEFRYRHMLNGNNEIVIGLSQSGETADTLACLREAKTKDFSVLSFVNVKGSSMSRESDYVIHTHSGPEIGVASTKNYVAQLLNMYLFSLYMGRLRWNITEADMKEKLDELQLLPGKIESLLAKSDQIKQIAQKYAHSRNYLFIGRQLNYPTALEGALKLKEISYIHATGYAAGELKHGPIALIDEHMPIVCLLPKTETYSKMISNIEEVKARKGHIIIIGEEGDTLAEALADDFIGIPSCSEDISPILSVIPLQLLSLYTASILGCNVDQPRNLAKSVTVE